MNNPFMLDESDSPQNQQKQPVAQGQQITSDSQAKKNPFMLDDNDSPDAATQEQVVTQDQYQPSAQVNTESEGYTGEIKKTAGSFMDKVDIFNRQFERMALGTMQALTPDNSSVGQAIEQVRKHGYGGVVVGQEGEQQAWENLKDPMTGAYDPGAYEAAGAGIVGSNLAFGNLLMGAGSMAMKGLGATGSIGAGVVDKVGKFVANNPGKSSVIQGVGLGSGLSMMDEADSGEQRLAKGVIGGILGGAIPAVYQTGKWLGNIAFKDRGHSGYLSQTIDPKKAVINDMAEKIKGQFQGNTDDALAAVKKTSDIMKKTGVNMTAGEAFPDTIGYKEKNLKLDDITIDKSVEPAYFKSQEQAVSKFKSIVDDMGPKNAQGKPMSFDEIDAVQTNLFKQMEGEFINPDNTVSNTPYKNPMGIPGAVDELPDVIKNNPTLMETLKEVKSIKNGIWENLPDNSISQLHKVKYLLSQTLSKAKPKGNLPPEISLDAGQELKIMGALDQISGVLKQSPTYQEAMKLSQQKIIMDRYKSLLDAPNSGLEDTRTLTDIYKTIFPKKSVNAHKDQFIQDVIDTGGNIEQAKATVELLDKLQKSPLRDLIKQEGGGVYQRSYGKPSVIAQETLNKVTDAGYDRAMLEVTLNPTWTDEVAKVLQSSSEKSKLEGMASVMMKALKWVNANVTAPALKGIGRGAQRAFAVEGARRVSGQKNGYLQ